MSETKTPLHVVSLEASNMMRLSAVRIVPGKGPLVLISGANGAGKSSVLNCIDIGARGADALPDQPIREGQTAAETTMDIGEFVIKTKVTAAGGRSRTIRCKDGTPPKSPQAMLDSFYSKAAFDPMAFLSWPRPKQVAELRRLAGVDTTTIDALRASLSDQRKQLGWKVETAKGAVEATPDPGVPADEPKVDPATVDAEIAQANQAVRDWDTQNNALSRHRIAYEANDRAWGQCDEEVRRCEAALNFARERKDAAKVTRDKSFEEWDKLNKALPPKPVVDTGALQAARNDIVDRNARIDKAAARAKAVKYLAELEARWTDTDKQIKANDAKQERMIAAAKLPVDGLSFNDAGVTFNGLPFEQASSAEKIRVSVAIAMANSPRLKVALVREGSLLDDNSLKLLAEAAEAMGAQVWVEVAGKRAGAIEIVDGEVAESEAKPAS